MLAAKRRADEVSKLRATHDSEIQLLVADKASLVTKFSDLEGEVLTLRASAAPAEAITSPKRNGSASAPSETVTKEELQSMHEAHNLKMLDLQAQHDMLNTVRQRLVDLMKKGNGPKEMVAAKPTKEFDEKWGDPELFILNAYRGLWGHVRELGGIV